MHPILGRIKRYRCFSLYTMSIWLSVILAGDLDVHPLQDDQTQRVCLMIMQVSQCASPGDGGAYRDRTDDLLNANQALSQLS